MADLQMPPKGKLTANTDCGSGTVGERRLPCGPALRRRARRKKVFDLANRKAEHWAWQAGEGSRGADGEERVVAEKRPRTTSSS